MLVSEFDKLRWRERGIEGLLAHETNGPEILKREDRKLMVRIWAFLQNERQFTPDYDVKTYQEDMVTHMAISNVNQRIRSAERK